MSPDVVSRSLSVHQEHELLLALQRAGLDTTAAQRAIDNKSVAENMVWAARERLYQTDWLRTANTGGGGNRVCVGRFSENGLLLECYAENVTSSIVSLTSAVKPS